MQTHSIANARTSTEVMVLGPGQGEDVWFTDNLLTIKARPATGTQFGVIESTLPEGSHTPFHRHDHEDEAFYVLEGRMKIYVDGRAPIEVGPGCYVHTPRGAAHGFVTLTPVRMLVLCGVEGFVEMAREAGMPAPRHELPPAGPPDIARLEAACARNHITLLGPLPG
ncbi:MAG TPA: cupin domain-containing protein [Kofleriaceae bacterium]|nr:cupin domain-containing protein [Kofleriaceae bacterium]